MGLRNLLRLRERFANEFEAQQARALYTIALIVLIASSVLGIAIVLTAAREQYETFQIVVLGALVRVNPSIFLPVVLVTVGLVLFLIQRGSLEAARIIFVGGLLISVALLNFLIGDNTMQSRVLIGYVIPIVAGGVLLRRSGALTVTGIVLISLLLQALLISVGLVDYPRTPPTPAYIPFVLLVFAVSGGMLVAFVGSQRTLLQTNLNLDRELSRISALSRIVSEVANIDELLNKTLALMHEKLGYYHVQIFLTEEKSDALSLVASTGSLPAQRDGSARRLMLNSPSVIAEVARAGRTQRISADAPPARRGEFAPAVRAELVVPLRVGDATIGVLDLQSTDSEAFSAREIESLEALAVQLALAIQNLRLQQALQLANRDQQELIEQVRTASHQIERLNQEMSGRAWQLYLQSRSEQVISFDWDGDMLTSGTRTVPMPTRSTYGYIPYIEDRDGAQYLVVPIVSRGQALGVMEFRAPDGQFWDDRSVELARAIAQRLALSLDNLRLYDQAQMAIAREQIANRVATELQAKSDVDTLVAVAVDAFQQALGALQTSVRLGLPTRRDQDASSNGYIDSGAAS